MWLQLIVRESLRALVRNKMRSLLTVLGITIGIGAVICVVEIGQAGSKQVEKQLDNLGENFIWIEAGSRAPNGIRTGSHGTKTLTEGDSVAILKQIPFIKAVTPNIDERVQVIYGNRNWNTMYRGVGPEYFQIKRWDVVQGVPFTHEDVQRAATLCVIGDTLARQLFTGENPLGKTLRIKDMPCQVIGVLGAKGQSGFGQDQDDTVLLPYTTVQRRIIGNDWIEDIMCSAISQEAINPAINQITLLLRDRHKIRAGQDDDFNIRRPDEVIQARLAASRTFSLLLVVIASVSLLVGGIGIMNVMLVSVTERTREIGVRMSVGATEGEVQVQFLGEAVMLSLFGGVAGVLLGIGGSYAIGNALQWPISISPEAIMVAAAFASFIGVFFGFYPALKASRLDPIQALRFE